METIFSEDYPIIDLNLCSDQKTVTYLLDTQMVVRNIRGDKTLLGEGSSLRSMGDGKYVACCNGSLVIIDADGKRQEVKAKGDLVKKLSTVEVCSPSPNRHGNLIACSIGGITLPNLWGEREYCGLVNLDKGVFDLYQLETYGGKVIFAPQLDQVVLNSWELKGGSLYFLKLDGEIVTHLVGSSPSFSPSGEMVAFIKENVVNVAKYDGTSWEMTDHWSQPEEGIGSGFNPPIWLDERSMVYQSGEILYRFDLEKNNAKKIEQIPGLAVRRSPFMVGPIEGGILLITNESKGQSAKLLQL